MKLTILLNHYPVLIWRHLWYRMIGGVLLVFVSLYADDLVAEAMGSTAIRDPEPMPINGMPPRSASFQLSTTRPIGNREIAGRTNTSAHDPEGNFSQIQKVDDELFQVGVVLPLSGPFSALGQDFLNAVIMALFDVDDKDISLLVSDSKGTKEGAEAAAVDVILRGADVVLGPVFDFTIAAASSVSRQANIPLIGFSANRHVVGEGVYLLNFSPEQQVDRIVGFASEQNIIRFAALIPQGRYGALMEHSFRAAVAKYGGEIIKITYYSAQFDQLEVAAKELASSGIGQEGDAVFIPEGGNILISLVSFLSYYDIDPQVVRFLGTGLWDDPLLNREPSLRQGWFSSPSRHKGRHFQNNFWQQVGHIPPRIIELGYDAFLIAALLQKQDKGLNLNLDNISLILTRDGGFMGINGLFRFLPNGLSERGLSIFEVGQNKMKEISPASNTFQEDNLQ